MLFPSLEGLQIEKDNSDIDGIGVTFSTIEYTFKTLLDGIKNKIFTPHQLEMDIVNNYQRYCDYSNFQNPSLRRYMQELWVQPMFLNAFLTVQKYLGNRIPKEFICKIAFDYCSDNGVDLKDEVTSLFFKIIDARCSMSIVPLTTVMSKVDSIFLIMCRYGSYEYSECIQRVNDFIISSGYDFSVRDIIEIYSIIYKEKFSEVFTDTMITPPRESYDENQKQMYHRITTAIFIIVNSMTTSDIEKVLTDYIFTRKNNGIKFERADIIARAKEEYPRIYSCTYILMD